MSSSSYGSVNNSPLGRQFGGLASLAGISFGGSDSGDKALLAIEVMKSRQFIARFIENYDLLVPLIAAHGWNRETDELIIDSKIYDVEQNIWLDEGGVQKKRETRVWDAYVIFSDMLSISRSNDSGLVSVSIDYYSPFMAKEWVENLVKDINSEMKLKDVSEARKSIGYLKSQLENTQITQMQNVFYQLIEEQTKTLMLSETRDQYIFTTIDPAVVPEEKAKPKRTVIFVLGTLIGFTIGIVIVLVRHFVKRF